MLKRITNYKVGDRVTLNKDCCTITLGDMIICKGSRGTLERLYRIQNGVEVWSMKLEEEMTVGKFKTRFSIAVRHTDFE
jgi:hypothetical protein